jgi:hypothetical protein
MDDKAQIQQAYGAMIQLLFKVFSEQERSAEERFKSGIAHVRHIRDRAISLLQPEA